MADKGKGPNGPSQKVVSMKLFATWEVEKSSPNCIPRICSLTLTNLAILKPLESDLSSVIISVRMQVVNIDGLFYPDSRYLSSKRVLRSVEVEVPITVPSEVPLDLSFIMQYPHFMKRDNKLEILLQRRKRYKNRPMIGYKTLAIGQLSLAQVLQHSVDRDLHLYKDMKNQKEYIACVKMVSLSSQPINHEYNQNGHRKLFSSDIDRSPDIDADSEEDEQEEDQEIWSNDEMSDSEPTMTEEESRRSRKPSRSKRQHDTHTARQTNLKQKFIALLKRFKISEDVLASEADNVLGDQEANNDDIDELIDELESLTDSDPELDVISVMSTPKPRLRPFFTGRGSTNDIDRHSLTEYHGRTSDDNSSNSHAERDTDPESGDLPTASGGTEVGTMVTDTTKVEVQNLMLPKSPSPVKTNIRAERSTSYKERKNKKEHIRLERHNSVGWEDQSPRKALLDQLSTVLGGADEKLPDTLVLVNTQEWQGQYLVQKLQDKPLRLICTCSDADVRASVSFLVTKIQKLAGIHNVHVRIANSEDPDQTASFGSCNSNSKSPNAIKLGVAGSDGYINTVLRPYIEQFSAKSPDWQNYVRFLVIPFGSSNLGKYLASVDSAYNSLFMDSLWRDTFDKTENKLDTGEILSRVSKYLSSAGNVVHIPVAEAMVMCKGKGSDEESSQIFIPFLSEVKVGSSELLNMSVDLDDTVPSPVNLSSSPPQSDPKQRELGTPPNSPNVSGPAGFQSGSTPTSGPSLPLREYVELQVDYWTVIQKPESTDKGDKSSKKDSNKSSLKSSFKSVQVTRLPHGSAPQGDNQMIPFTLVTVMREKKQKIRIGKKSKDGESKSQVIEAINRLICTSKSQNHSLKVLVDGVEWTGVKFFQLSSQWQTHMKHFPIAVFSNTVGEQSSHGNT